MASFKPTVITTKGKALQAKTVAGDTKMRFTKVQMSESDYRPLSVADIEALTELSVVNQEVRVSSTKVINITSVQVKAAIDNATVTSGYYIRAIGLWATDPDEGEILYSVTVVEDNDEDGKEKADWMPPYNGLSLSSIELELITVVSNAASVSLNIDPTAYVLRSDLDEAVTEAVGQVASISKICHITIPKDGWEEDPEPSDDHKYYCDVYERGVTAAHEPVGGADLGYHSVGADAGMVEGVETRTNGFRFYSMNIPKKDIQATIILWTKGAPGGGGGQTVVPGVGLAWNENGELDVQVGDGIDVDELNRLKVDRTEVITDEDMVNEDEAKEEMKNILLTGSPNPDEEGQG